MFSGSSIQATLAEALNVMHKTRLRCVLPHALAAEIDQLVDSNPVGFGVRRDTFVQADGRVMPQHLK